MNTSRPILYTFRRCPYAIRSQMALAYAKIDTYQVEVDLKNKPIEMVNASAKATVPVLILENETVIDQSLDIMRWALEQSDPDGWLTTNGDNLIHYNDTQFKPMLDGYKYAQHNSDAYRDKAHDYLQQLNTLLSQNHYFLNDKISIADVAIFPFIRQFYMVDQNWFNQRQYSYLQAWLEWFLKYDVFLHVMKK